VLGGSEAIGQNLACLVVGSGECGALQVPRAQRKTLRTANDEDAGAAGPGVARELHHEGTDQAVSHDSWSAERCPGGSRIQNYGDGARGRNTDRRGRRLNRHVRRLWSLAEPQPNAAPFSRRFGGSLRVAALLLAALLLTGGQHQACQRRAGPPPSFPVFVHGSRDSSGKVTALTASGGEGHEDGYRRGGRKGEEHPHARDHGKPYPDQQRKGRREDEQGTVGCLRPAGDDEGLLRRHPGIGECIFRRVHQNQGHRCVPAADDRVRGNDGVPYPLAVDHYSVRAVNVDDHDVRFSDVEAGVFPGEFRVGDDYACTAPANGVGAPA
jgi:hypothetical protein